MYHRQLIRLPAGVTDVKTIRIATAATAGGASASVETFPVTEWLGKNLPPHVAGFKNQPFFTNYMDPTENRADLDALAAPVPGPDVGRQHAGEDLGLPAQVAGDHERHERHRRGSARPPSAPRCSTPRARSRPRRRSPAIPFTGTAGQAIRATVDGDPVRLDRLHPDPQGPHRHRPAVDRHGHEPGARQPDAPTAGTYTFEVSGFQGDLGDFTFKIQPTRSARPRPPRSCSPPRTGARTAATRSWPSSAARPATTCRSASPSTAS